MNDPSPVRHSTIDLVYSPGQLTIVFAELFALTSHAPLRRFVESVLGVDAVDSVLVQFDHGEAVLRFDERRVRVWEMLENVAQLLQERSTSRSGGPYLPVAIGRDGGRKNATRFCPVRNAWQVSPGEAGEFLVRNRLLDAESGAANALAARITEASPAASAKVAPGGRSISIQDACQGADAVGIQSLLRQAVEREVDAYWNDLRRATELRVVTGSRRLLYVGLTLASFGMMVVAFIFPGIPTPPFLIATTYFGVRSSPGFYRWLSQSWLFGRMVRDWRDHRAFRREDKIKSVLLTMALIVVGIVWLDVSGPLLIAVISIAAVEIIWLLSMPEVGVPRGHANGAGSSLMVASAS